MDDLTTYAANTWCPGCGNFGIFNAYKKAIRTLEERGLNRKNIAISAGIGCHGKIFGYLKLSGIYSLHGRSVATVQGMKLANPDLKVITSCGDGDIYGEGISHLIFAAKRNADITVIVHNNGVYGLTTGQYTPTSLKGFRGPSTPQGSVEEPLNPLSLLLEAGATFVARGFPVNLDHLADLIVRAVEHPGFSFIDVLQPCVSFNNTYEKYNALTEIIEHTPASQEAALALAKRKDRLPIGVFYQVAKPPFHQALYGEFNPVLNRMSPEKRREKIRQLLSPA